MMQNEFEFSVEDLPIDDQRASYLSISEQAYLSRSDGAYGCHLIEDTYGGFGSYPSYDDYSDESYP